MRTLGCEHADAGPVLVVTGENGGFDAARTALAEIVREAWLASPESAAPYETLSCSSFYGTLPRIWRETVHALYRERRPTFLCTAHPGAVDEVYFTDAADLRLRVLRWRGGRLENLSSAEAERLWRAYEVGIQHVSEILRDKWFYEGRCTHEAADDVITGYPRRCTDCGEAVRR